MRLTLIILCLGLGFVQGQTVFPLQETDSLNIDGSAADWTCEMSRLEKENIQYAFQQDSEFLYLMLRFPEDVWQHQVIVNGLTLWLEPNGKKSQRKGILFPIGLPDQLIPRDPYDFQLFINSLNEAQKRKYLAVEEMLLIGYYGGDKDDVVMVDRQTKGALEVAANLAQNGDVIYEAAIPKAALNGAPTFRWGLETGELGRPEMRGTDAVGLSGGSISNPERPETVGERNFQRVLEFYRLHATTSEYRSKKISL